MTDPSYQSGPTWKPYYSARDAYAPLLSPPLPYTSPLDARLWHRVTDVFEKNETAFQDFAMRLHRGYKWKACGEYCRRRWIAHLRAGNSLFNGDTVPLGLHIDSAEAVLPLAKRGGRAEEWWVDAPGVEEDELDPKHAGCSLHGYDAGAIMRNMVRLGSFLSMRFFDHCKLEHPHRSARKSHAGRGACSAYDGPLREQEGPYDAV